MREKARANIQLGTTAHRTGNGMRQGVSSETIALVLVLVPVLPAGLKQVHGGQEGEVSEQGRDGIKVWLAIRGNDLLNLGSQVRQLGQDSRAELICGQETRLAVQPEDRRTVQEGHQGLEDLRQGCGGSGIGHEAS